MSSVISFLSQQQPVPENTELKPFDINTNNSVKPVEMRLFGDASATRKNIYNNVLNAFKNIKPVSNNRYSLSLSDVEYIDPEDFDIATQKKAILHGDSLNRRIRGVWSLKNPDGKVVEQKRATLAQVPYMTPRGTFIFNGVEYTLAHQMRLRPGVFTRVKDNGELESHVNVMPGKGISHRYFLEPETGIFKVNIGQSNMPLYPIIKAMGVTDNELRQVWGNKLYEANAGKDDPRVIDKLYTRLAKKIVPGISFEDKKKFIANTISSMEFDPDVTRRTLRQPFSKMDKDAMLATTSKLMAVSRGEEAPDDRDHLAFQTFLGPEDLIAERVNKSGNVLNQLLWKSAYKGNLNHIMPSVLSKNIQAAIFDSGLSQCFDDKTYVMTRRGWVLWPEVVDTDEFLVRTDHDSTSYAKATKIFRLAYSGDLYTCDSKTVNYAVTPNHRCYVSLTGPGGIVWRFETAERIHNRTRRFKMDVPFCEDTEYRSQIGIYKKDSEHKVYYDTQLFLKFLGVWLCRGSVDINSEQIILSEKMKKKPEWIKDIKEILIQLNLEYTYNSKQDTFYINSPDIYEFLKDHIDGKEKRIPRLVFELANEQLKYLFDSYMRGDGQAYAGNLKAETTSEKLAMDLVELVGRLGFTGILNYRKYTPKNKNPIGYYVVVIRLDPIGLVLSDVDSKTKNRPVAYSIKPYDGMVYCASVPGQCLYVMRKGRPHWSGNSLEEINPSDVFDQQTRVSRLGYGGIPSMDAVPDEARSVQPSHLNYIDILRTPESFKVGIDSRVSSVVKKGNDGRIYSKFIDPKGNEVWKTPQEVAEVVLAFPGEMERNKKMVRVVINGNVQLAPKEKVQLIMPPFENAFSPLTNVVPLKSTIKGQRVAMGSRFITQALPLEGGEAPLVQTGIPGEKDRSYEDLFGVNMGAVRAEKMSGRVSKVTPNSIIVKYEDGSTKTHDIYNNFPYNRKTFLHNTVLVKPDDPVVPGQLLAKSNYTDNTGAMALGKNLKVAYIPFRGSNYEDAFVVSESAAKKFSSEHMYQHVAEIDDKIKKGKKSYLSIFPATYDRNTLDKLDDDGAIKEGMTVNYGDPIVLMAKQSDLTHKQIHSSHKGSFSDNTITWEHSSPGIVTDVAKTKNGITVAIKSLTPATIGDKIAGRYGDKGVIAAVIPDDEMIQDENGNAYDVLANSTGIISRTNPGQIIEGALGKIAQKTGKPYKVVDFSNDIDDMTEYAIKELEKHNLPMSETVLDPTSGRRIKNINTGVRYYMKLQHTAESKGQGRGLGSYTSEEMPARGGDEGGGSKRTALMDVHAYLSHGATQVLRDAKLIRGQKNQEYWSTFMSGNRPPTPKVPLVYEKFINQLKASGINVTRSGNKTNIMALTNKDVERMTEDRELKNAETVDWKDGMKGKAGGLFDLRLTGGHGGNRWSYIGLQDPMPNPIMEEPIRRLLGLTQKSFEEVLSGKKELNNMTGPEAIGNALKSIRVDSAIEKARQDIASGKRSYRDDAIKRLNYLVGAKKAGIHPSEWMLKRVPVLPPLFRPVSIMQGSDTQLVSDANYLYKEVFDANQNLKDITGKVSDRSEELLNLYKSIKGVTGLGDPVHPKNKEKNIQGMLKQIFGNSPKYGTVQQKLIGSNADLVGRAVVIPNPDLNMDELGLPEERAWEIYTPFMVRRMVRSGMHRLDALQLTKDKSPSARKYLLEEMQSRPVIMTRAPVLHRYGALAFWPKLTKGDVLHVNPTIVGGLGMDFDGDASNYHVPASDEAREEAIVKMMPSRNLISVNEFKAHYIPRQEYVGGLWSATAKIDTDKKPRTFATMQDVIRAFARGEIEADHPVHVLNK